MPISFQTSICSSATFSAAFGEEMEAWAAKAETLSVSMSTAAIKKVTKRFLFMCTILSGALSASAGA